MWSVIGASQVVRCKESACQCSRRQRHRFHPWIGKTLWSRKWKPTPGCSCLEDTMNRGARPATVHWVKKEWDTHWGIVPFYHLEWKYQLISHLFTPLSRRHWTSFLQHSVSEGKWFDAEMEDAMLLFCCQSLCWKYMLYNLPKKNPPPAQLQKNKMIQSKNGPKN